MFGVASIFVMDFILGHSATLSSLLTGGACSLRPRLHILFSPPYSFLLASALFQSAWHLPSSRCPVTSSRCFWSLAHSLFYLSVLLAGAGDTRRLCRRCFSPAQINLVTLLFIFICNRWSFLGREAGVAGSSIVGSGQ